VGHQGGASGMGWFMGEFEEAGFAVFLLYWLTIK
jgi:hypothetical protein